MGKELILMTIIGNKLFPHSNVTVTS